MKRRSPPPLLLAHRMALSLLGYEWTLSPVEESRIDQLMATTGLSPIAARCLTQRIPESVESPSEWLRPGLNALHDPFLMHDMDRAIARLQQAIKRKEHVRIITDYDVDGTTSSLIL